MPKHKRSRRLGRRLGSVAVTSLALVSVSGVAYAASLVLSSATLGAGSAPVVSCDAAARIGWETSFRSATTGVTAGYLVSRVSVTSGSSGAALCAGSAFKITLTGPDTTSSLGQTRLVELTGTFDSAGKATVDVPTATPVRAADVTSAFLVVTGTLP